MKGKTMRKLLFALASTGLTTLTAFGQGAVIIDNTSAPGYLDIMSNGATYTGRFGLEVWYKNAAAPDNAINSLNGFGSDSAYALLTADGFSLATTKPNAGTASGGIFSGVGEVDIKAPGGSIPPGQAGPGLDRTVNGGKVLLALVFWSGTGSSFLGAVYGGVITFVNPTSDWTIPPPNTPLPPFTDNFAGNGAPYTDLIMDCGPCPEPSVFGFVGLGAATVLAVRRGSAKQISAYRSAMHQRRR
jgi:hypothetical protein